MPGQSPAPESATAVGVRRARRARLFAPLLTLALVIAAAGCSSAADGRAGASPAAAKGDRPVVVTTVAPLTSIVAAIAGNRADVRGLVPEGTNSHTFEPPPSAAADLVGADLVVLNGLQLEEPTRRLAEANVRAGTTILSLGEATLTEDRWVYDFSFPRDDGRPNPHLWTDPLLAKRYGELVRDALTRLDPGGTESYRQAYATWVTRMDALDAAMRVAFVTVPADNRKLLTYHDAYAYFARDYGFTVVGAIQVADFEEPTAREVASLIGQVRDTKVPAIFGSEVFPSPVLEQIGRETGVRYVDTLRDDDLPGAPGEADHSLIGLLRDNYVTMTEALGGDASALRSLDIGPPTDTQARYPQ